jgi:hypothetical protein
MTLVIKSAFAAVLIASVGLSLSTAAQTAPPGGGAPDGARRAPASPEVIAARRAMRQTCAADMAKLCPDAHPGPGGGLMQCVLQHRADLSPDCSQAIGALQGARKAAR